MIVTHEQVNKHRQLLSLKYNVNVVFPHFRCQTPLEQMAEGRLPRASMIGNKQSYESALIYGSESAKKWSWPG